MMAQLDAIEVETLVRDYPGQRALDGVSFRVAAGEIFGLLGPNGAGKTTLIKILTGQLRPTAGQARVLGLDVVRERAQIKAQIGVVFETQNLYQNLSGRENLTFAARLYGAPAARVEEMLEWVHLRDRAGESLKRFSNGMKQRLLIARALLHWPQVLFLDEPTRGLDPNQAGEIRACVAALPAQGVTVFLTTHYMEEADQLCQRVAILDRGRIAGLDAPRRLKTEYGQTTLEGVFVALTGQGLSSTTRLEA